MLPDSWNRFIGSRADTVTRTKHNLTSSKSKKVCVSSKPPLVSMRIAYAARTLLMSFRLKSVIAQDSHYSMVELPPNWRLRFEGSPDVPRSSERTDYISR